MNDENFCKKQNNVANILIAVVIIVIIAMIGTTIFIMIKYKKEGTKERKDSVPNNIVGEFEEENGVIPSERFRQYKNDNYIVIYSYNNNNNKSTIMITDKSNMILYMTDKVVTLNGYNSTRNKPYIEDNVLYFATASDECYMNESGKKLPYVEYNSIDLTQYAIEATIIKTVQEDIDIYNNMCVN